MHLECIAEWEHSPFHIKALLWMCISALIVHVVAAQDSQSVSCLVHVCDCPHGERNNSMQIQASAA